jgi:hypothetical protein
LALISPTKFWHTLNRRKNASMIMQYRMKTRVSDTFTYETIAYPEVEFTIVNGYGIARPDEIRSTLAKIVTSPTEKLLFDLKLMDLSNLTLGDFETMLVDGQKTGNGDIAGVMKQRSGKSLSAFVTRSALDQKFIEVAADVLQTSLQGMVTAESVRAFTECRQAISWLFPQKIPSGVDLFAP